MKGLWSGISGIIENDEEPLSRAKIEIFEEVGINEEQIKLINSSKGMLVDSPQYKNHQWVIFPFLFETDKIDIKLNWENSEFRWIHVDQLKEFSIVPSLEKVLSTLL
jgi:8-oxo-dGTP pyrophosphatase MutT (NUDIX family)|tara:strand:- start:871 stop:1191 length:321 start_codon:yes stop_codon:yes gene_type:complete